jgi:hypothetical protein
MPLRWHRLWAFRAMLGLAALDSVASGGWVMLQPNQFFDWLHLDVPGDAFLLPALGGLLFLHGICLIAAVVRPAVWGGFVWLPLLGRLLNGSVWLWLLGAERIAAQAALLLLAHEALWLPGFVVFLTVQRRFASATTR